MAENKEMKENQGFSIIPAKTEMKEKEFVEQELSHLLEITLQLEDELNSIVARD